MGKIEGLKDIGVHSKRVPAFILPGRCLQARDLDLDLLKEYDRCLGSAQLTLADDICPTANPEGTSIIFFIPQAIMHQNKAHIVLTVVAHHAAYVIHMLTWANAKV